MAHRTIASASSSSSSAPYDIFINHRGPDVKNAFARHLYRSLNSRGLRVFLDQPELQAGQNIPSQIKAAIQVAFIHIAIFSRNYAESNWCLEELSLMVESEKTGATILPVFHNVKPSELRWTGTEKDGPYAKALRKHEEKQRYDSQTIQKWREALSHVADISGFELEACNGDEAELLDQIMQRVLKEVPKPSLHVPKYATGLRGKIEDLEKTVLSQQEGRVRVLGIVGLGGVGKTTLANEFFNSRRSNYDGSSFLPDVREKASKSLLPSLQSKLIKDLKGINSEIERWEEGTGILERYLSSCHALIILDDVNDADQLDAFLPIMQVLDPKSLILVTSRDKHVLISAGLAESSIYHVKGLDTPHSQELFCWHAFFQPRPRPGFENLVVRFLNRCDGLPLSLKVFGVMVCEKDESYWEEKLNEFQKLPPTIMASLKISFDALDPEEQQIFLDIACFAIGDDRDMWKRIWGGLAGLQTLEDKCLVEVDSQNAMTMHDHLRDMGRNIAEQLSMPRRLWRSIEDVHDLFEEQSSSSVIPKVRGIRIAPWWTRGFIREERLLRSKSEIALSKSSSHKACRIRKLQLLDTEGEFVQGILSRVRSPNLIWLRWNDCPCSSLPSCIPLNHLRVLQVTSWKLKRLWQCESQAPLQLRELNVEAPLLEFPKSIGKLKYLEKVVLSYSDYLPEPADVATLPEEFCHVRSLKYLELKRCLGSLPNDFGNLTNLQHIDLSGCKRLKKLPDSFTDLKNLQHINLSGCERLKKLPDSFTDLKNLQHVNLSGCERLKKLPDSFTDLRNLQHIDLSECNRLKRLPKSLGNLANLQHINLYGCKSLKKLPNSLGDLTNLQHIDLQYCSELQILPHMFGNLTNLQRIDLVGCESLEVLPDSFGNLTNVRDITLHGCESLKTLPDSFGNLKNLQYINMKDCSLNTIPNSFRNLTNLHCIYAVACGSLKILPSNLFGNLTNLQQLYLFSWESLEKLPDSLGNLTKLHSLNLSACTSLKELPNSLGDLTNLQSIVLESCKSLKKLPDSLGNLTKLHCINLSACTNLKELPDSLGDLTNLHSINLNSCKSLKKLPHSLGNLTELHCINLSACTSLKKLPDSFGHLTNLSDLDLSGCNNMKKLPKSLGNLLAAQVEHEKSLEMLNLLGTNLKELTNVVCLSNLKYLYLGSPLLKELPPSLGCLTSLKKLLLHGCQELKRLPDSVGLLTQLTVLEISKCGIYDLTGLMKMNNLEILTVRGCPLRELPFKEESAPGRKRKRRAKDKGLIGLKELELYCTEISEVSFPEGVCLNLQTLRIWYCNDLLEVGSLPARLGHLILRGCGALRKIGGLCGVAKLEILDITGCNHIEVEELPHLGDVRCLFTPGNAYNRQEEEERVEKEMAALQEGVLPSRFASGSVTFNPESSPFQGAHLRCRFIPGDAYNRQEEERVE